MPLPAKKSLLRKRRPPEEAEMDITPMIDCTFLLLIFFLVSSKMNADVPIELPVARHGGAVAVKSSIIVTVAATAAGEVQVFRGDSLDAKDRIAAANLVEQEDAIAQYIEQEAKANPLKRNVLIKGAKGLKYKEIARVFQAASRADVDQLYVAVLESN
jgi:biopolymer transport protein ExbD